MTAFIDTNVLVYAQTSDPRGETAREILRKGGTVSAQVLNEFTNVLRKKLGRSWDEIDQAIADVEIAVGVALPLTASHNQDARAIASRDGITFFDALIISSAAQANCGTLLTEDMQAGRTISGVKIVNPFAN